MFDQAKADAVCARLAEGESLRKAAKSEGVGVQTVLDWCDANKEFSGQYALARSRGYSLLADQIIELSDTQDADSGMVARNRLQVDSRKWMLSKMLPKVYGDKIEHEHKGGVTISLSNLDEQA